MMYRIYDYETDELMTFPPFKNLDLFEDYLDNHMEAWDSYDVTEDGDNVYECTPDGESKLYLVAVLEA